MSIVIQLLPETEKELTERAGKAGQEVGELARELIERGLRKPPSLDEILAPFRAEVEQSGMSEMELEAMFEEAREEAFREKQGKDAQ